MRDHILCRLFADEASGQKKGYPIEDFAKTLIELGVLAGLSANEALGRVRTCTIEDVVERFDDMMFRCPLKMGSCVDCPWAKRQQA